MNSISENISILEAFIHLATSFLPNSDTILRKASVLLIKMIGATPRLEHPEKCLRKCKSKEKIVEARRFLKLQRLTVENKITRTRLSSRSYMTFLLYHKQKHLSYKAKYWNRPVKSVLLTIEESDEI